MYSYFIPVFAQSLGATFLDLGIIGTVPALLTAIIPTVAAYTADRLNRAWVFCLSLMINAVATFALGFARTVVDIVSIRFVGGIGAGAFWLTGEILVTELAPSRLRVKDMGKFGIALALGALIGPIVGGLIAQVVGYFDLFMFSFAVIALALALTVLRVVPGYKKNVTQKSEGYAGNLGVFRRLLPLYMMLLCYGVVWGVITSIFPGYANSVGISAVLIGILFGAFGVTRIFSYATAYRYLRFGERTLLVLTSLMIFAGLLTIGVVSHFIGFLVGVILIGGAVGIVFPVSVSLVSRHFPAERTGVAVGSYETAVNWGETIGPYLGGVLASEMTVGSSFLTMSVFGLLMATFALNGRRYRTAA
jgi:MFS family permease